MTTTEEKFFSCSIFFALAKKIDFPSSRRDMHKSGECVQQELGTYTTPYAVAILGHDVNVIANFSSETIARLVYKCLSRLVYGSIKGEKFFTTLVLVRLGL